jgi:mono/diheme cytochrome c family protein
MITLASSLAGCGDASQMRFVEDAATAKSVHFKARREVQKVLEEHFGTPLNSVAWLKLPVNYGRAEGTVKSVDGRSLLVEFNPELTDLESLKSPDLNRAGLLLTSGASQGQTLALAGFDAERASFEIRGAGDVMPANGDRFVVAGQYLSHGRKLYARHCQHCHGVSGDGDGPTAKYLNPRPRDYRLGIFKFTSTDKDTRATREDLTRVIAQGIPGTYMPAFVPLLKDQELKVLVEYVRWLAMRGQLERQLLTELKNDFAADRAAREEKESGGSRSDIEKQIDRELQTYVKETLPGFIDEVVGDLATAWEAAEAPEAPFIPPIARVVDNASSRERGRRLFLKDGKCVNCHGPSGRGNGFQTEDYQKNEATGAMYAVRGLHDVWGQPIKPRDLTRGIYRGGRRPIDIYRRIAQGIKGTPMPPAPNTLKPEDIWDIVNYVLSVPFESSSPGTPKAYGVAGHPAGQEQSN